MKACSCYVSGLNAKARYCLRYGAHDTDCPVYRVSLDPADRANDEEFRQRALNIIAIGNTRNSDYLQNFLP